MVEAPERALISSEIDTSLMGNEVKVSEFFGLQRNPSPAGRGHWRHTSIYRYTAAAAACLPINRLSQM